MDLLKQANVWVQKGYEIKYLIVDQFKNSYGTEVIAGEMPKYSYSFVIDKDDEELWDYSVNSLEEGYSMAIKWLEKNQYN